MSEVTISEPTKMNITFDHLAPTLSAIMAGIVHHMCREKRQLTFIDFLLIISPSLPVLSTQFLKLIAFVINFMCNGIFGINIGFLTHFIDFISKRESKKSDTIGVGFDKEERIIFPKYTVEIDISKKMEEWQKEGLYVRSCSESELSYKNNRNILLLVENITKHNLTFSNSISNTVFVNFYNEFTIDTDKVYVYITNTNKEKKLYKIYRASTNINYTSINEVYCKLYPTEYIENKSKYRVSRIYNEYSKELLTTIMRFKESLTNNGRKVCTNFCFAGPPGTCKTYAARAIAKELTREIVEVNISSIVYEKDFFEIFTKNDVSKSVFLFDEIDLMCPSREFDDKLIKNAEESRLTTFGVKSNNELMDYESENSSLTEEDGFVNKKLLHQIHLLQDEMKKLHEKMNETTSFQEWLKNFLEESFKKVYYGFITMNLTGLTGTDISKLRDIFKVENFTVQAIMNYFLKYMESNFAIQSKNSISTSSISTSSISNDKTPFTLRTLLNYISGGNTPDDLVIIATTNRPEKLDPALIRPGRLRLMEFKNLRKIDIVNMLLENYSNEKSKIEEFLENIHYEDYMISGALLEAIISSCNDLNDIFQIIQREIQREIE